MGGEDITAEEVAAIAKRAEARAEARATSRRLELQKLQQHEKGDKVMGVANGVASADDSDVDNTEEARRVAEIAARANGHSEHALAASAANASFRSSATESVGTGARPVFLNKAQREERKQKKAETAVRKKEARKEPGSEKPQQDKPTVKQSSRNQLSCSSSALDEPLRDPEVLNAIKAQYVGGGVERKKKKNPNARSTGRNSRKPQFDWGCNEDTSVDLDPLYANRFNATNHSRLGRQNATDSLEFAGRRPGKRSVDMGNKETLLKRRRAALSWREKRLEDMTDRDWRIVREDFDIYVKGGRIPNPARSWDEMDLPGAVRESVRQSGYERPSAIQIQAIPCGLRMRDLIGVAETGSGKTAAFVIPLLAFLSRQSPDRLQSCNEDGPLAVIMGPTRELVQQIGEETRKLSAGMPEIQTAIVVGGNAMADQVAALRQGSQIIAATPGRLIDCLENRYVVFNQCCYLVLDEADRMIDMGFEPQVESVLTNMAATQKADDEAAVIEQERLACLDESNNKTAVDSELNVRLTIMFSATMPPAVEQLAAKYMRFPAIIRVGDQDSGKNRRITQNTFLLPSENAKKQKLLTLLRETAAPIIIFANSKKECDIVTKYVQEAGWRATVMHSGKAQAQREASLLGFKQGRFDVLVATDVAGRGLDISDVAHVINYEMSSDIERYTHRIGRTGRAGKSGLASTLLTEDDASIFKDLVLYLESTKARVPRELSQHPKSRHQGEIDA